MRMGALLPAAPCRLQGGEEYFLESCQVFPEDAANVTLFLLSLLCYPSSFGGYSKYTSFYLLGPEFVSLVFSHL